MLKKQNFNRLDILAFIFFLLTCYAGINFIYRNFVVKPVILITGYKTI